MNQIKDCGDNSCVFKVLHHGGGMRTNGGCRCFKNLMLNTSIVDAMDPTKSHPYNNRDDITLLERTVRKMAAEIIELRKKIKDE